MKAEDWPIVGYADPWSVAPGGKLRVMVSTDHDSYTSTVVRLGRRPQQMVESMGRKTHRGRRQTTHCGSYVLVPSHDRFDQVESLTIHAWIFPTRPESGAAQGIVTRLSATGGWGLMLDESGRLTFTLESADGHKFHCGSEHPLRARNWYDVSASYDHKTGKARLTYEALEPWPEPRSEVVADLPLRINAFKAVQPQPLLIGAGRWLDDPKPHATEPYDGKIENLSLFDEVLREPAIVSLGNGGVPVDISPSRVIASFDFSKGINSARVSDSSRNDLHGTTVNMPARGVTSRSWTGAEQSWTHAPEQYAAIHFHSDDVSDSGWDEDFVLDIPADTPSGVYAVHVASGTDTDDIPFFVTPGRTKSPIAFIAPTLTYLAYGNSRKWLATLRRTEPHRQTVSSDLFLAKHPELGMSLYDSHADGSGCFYASRLKPIVQMRAARSKPRHFPADLLLLEWLDRKQLACDVLTDEDLHRKGGEALDGYRALIVGSHPEYYSTSMLDALSAYVRSGGKLLYLGGNGFYWVTSFDPERSDVIEIRRGIGGTRDWNSEAGEHYHSTTGEFGGLWRHKGRAPNQLVGVGFSAVSGVGASGYARQADSFRDDVAFIFEGLTDDELIGNFGAIGGGAAGDELDRIGFELGTPPTTLLLATSAGLNLTFKVATEEILQTKEVPNNPKARADMTYYTNGAGGAVFSVGSINWFGSLATNNDDNNVSRITENVLRHFIGVETARSSKIATVSASNRS